MIFIFPLFRRSTMEVFVLLLETFNANTQHANKQKYMPTAKILTEKGV